MSLLWKQGINLWRKRCPEDELDMTNLRLVSLKQNIDDLINDADESLEVDDEKKSHLAKYACVLISGFLENAVYEVYRDYALRKNTDAKVLQFVEGRLKGINNPDGTRLVGIAGQFNATWSTELEEFMAENNRKGAIGSVIKNRHKIAHGETSSITLNLVKQYWERVVEVVVFMESQGV
jgi:hypothetical protein